MNYGLFISASGMQTSMARLDVASNNLANVGTDGFKPDMIAVRQRDVARIEDGLLHMDSNKLLERLGGGVMPTPTRVSSTQGALKTTNNPLDVALEGAGFIEVAPSSDGSPRYTRDGRLSVNGEGVLVLAANGRPIEDAGGGEIDINPTLPIEIWGDGSVVQGGAIVGRMNIVDLPGGVEKEGDSLLRALGDGDNAARESTARVVQGAVEQSGVDAISAIMSVTGAGKAAQSNARMIGYFDETMSQAIGTLGRVS